MSLVLVTDSTTDIPVGLAAELGIRVARARYGFADQTYEDGDLGAEALYARMAAEGPAHPFGTPETAFRAIFSELAAAASAPVCLVAPFDVNPSFTTALAAMLSLDDVDMKVLNAGVASAGLCSLLITFADGLRAGWSRDRLLAALDDLGPRCDTLFVPGDVDWLERTGRLPLIEERLGELDGGTPVLRAGTRITGVTVVGPNTAIDAMAARVAQRAGGAPVNVTITHACNPEGAAEAEASVRDRYQVSRLVITELSATYGSQLGPGAVGIGVAPAYQEAN
jgi:DegV family protein with EDD domain